MGADGIPLEPFGRRPDWRSLMKLWSMALLIWGVVGCSPPPATWHLRGALWRASQTRPLVPAGLLREDRRVTAPELDLPLAPNRPKWWPELSLGTESISVGRVNGGFLIRGRRLPEQGAHHRATADQLKRGTWEATYEMVSLILGAGAALAEVRPGTRLEVANIARRGGGRIPWSVSHQTGRDADLLLPLLRGGAPFLPGAMIPLDETGAGVAADGKAVQLDIPGLAAVVRSLAEQNEVGIRHLFLADSLRQMVLDFSKSRELPARVLRRMGQLLKQPRGTLPHNDHLHVRIMCAPDDQLDGCLDIGRRKLQSAPRKARVRELLKVARNEGGALGAQALRVLARLAPREEKLRSLLLASVGSREEAFHAAVLETLVGKAGTDVDRTIADWIRTDPSPRDQARALAIIEARTDRLWTRSIKAFLSAPTRSLPSVVGGPRTTVGEAIWLAGVTGDPRLLPKLLSVGARPGFGDEARRAIARILIPPPLAMQPEALDTIAEGFGAMRAREQTETIGRHLQAWGLLNEEGEVDRAACFAALMTADDAVFHGARRLLDRGHSRACRCPRWSKQDLRYYWLRRL